MGKRQLFESYDNHEKNVKEWEEAICPICMEPPHNAVLLQCSSLDRGCRPYICNTDVRHSGCLGQFYDSLSPPTSTSWSQEASSESSSEFDTPSKWSTARCPLCRGQVQGWEIIQPARAYINSRTRSCSYETCEFSGDYAELRKHVRSDHPPVDVREVDRSRWQLWTRLERQREIADLLSIARPSEEQQLGGEHARTRRVDQRIIILNLTGVRVGWSGLRAYVNSVNLPLLRTADSNFSATVNLFYWIASRTISRVPRYLTFWGQIQGSVDTMIEAETQEESSTTTAVGSPPGNHAEADHDLIDKF